MNLRFSNFLFCAKGSQKLLPHSGENTHTGTYIFGKVLVIEKLVWQRGPSRIWSKKLIPQVRQNFVESTLVFSKPSQEKAGPSERQASINYLRTNGLFDGCDL